MCWRTERTGTVTDKTVAAKSNGNSENRTGSLKGFRDFKSPLPRQRERRLGTRLRGHLRHRITPIRVTGLDDGTSLKRVGGTRRQTADHQDLLLQLKAAREAKGLSLSDLMELIWMDRSALSKLETGQRANPTVETLVRYAEAVGKRLVVTLSDANIE